VIYPSDVFKRRADAKKIVEYLDYNSVVKLRGTFRPRRSSACWVDFLVCPRRFLAVLPSHARANLFAGD
jgi:hypothetical protein